MKRLCEKFNIFALRSYLPVLIAIGLAVLFTSCTSFDHLTMVTEESFPNAKQCGKCHVEIYNEWANSDHAKAYTSQHFRKSTNNYRFEKCLSCHAPEPFVTETTVVTRTIDREEGVTCVSCHLKEGKLSGPIDPTGKIAPHPIGVNPDFYNDSGLCGKCHQREYSEWKNVDVPKKQNCQHCHMPQVKRKVTQATGGISNLIVAMEDEVLQKKHDFSIVSSESKTEIISIELKKIDSIVSVTIKNNLPHLLPTGDFGFRILKLKISAADKQGNLTVIDQRELAKELNTAIPPLSTLDIRLEVPVDTALIRVQLTRHSYESEKVINLTDVEVPLK